MKKILKIRGQASTIGIKLSFIKTAFIEIRLVEF
jgi:hypothetical protein